MRRLEPWSFACAVTATALVLRPGRTGVTGLPGAVGWRSLRQPALPPRAHGERPPLRPAPAPLRRSAGRAVGGGALARGLPDDHLPGLFGLGDAAKFAFVGKILGTPHAPGYPLYVMVSHLFSYIPLGTLAYRMNVLSALLAAVAVAISTSPDGCSGSSAPVALATSLALGFGHAFWSKALYAKGYTLNAALVAAGFLFLLTWGQSRERRHLYAAIAIFALSSGNHLIVIALVPALAPLRPGHRSADRALGADHPDHRRDWLPPGCPSTCSSSIGPVRTPRISKRAPTTSASCSTSCWRGAGRTRSAPTSPGALLNARVPLVAGLVTTELTVAGLVLVAVGPVRAGAAAAARGGPAAPERRGNHRADREHELERGRRISAPGVRRALAARRHADCNGCFALARDVWARYGSRRVSGW